MINEIFKNSFLYEYFETFFKTKKRFPQSIILEGQDILYGYFFTLELARILNCENRSADFNCTCTNCRWIKEGKHPCVICVTPLDFKEDGSSTVISVKQIEKITSLIRETSDYHRFFIFSNAVNEPPLEKNREKYFNAGYNIDLKNWQPLPLNFKILQEQAANALLKSTEEAPDRVSFIFLTDTKENILPTIVSRSLVFKIPFLYEKSVPDMHDFFENYPNSAIETNINLPQLFMEKYSDLIYGLNMMQDYLFNLLKSGKIPKEICISDIKKVETAKKQIAAHVMPKYALETLFISLSKNGRNL